MMRDLEDYINQIIDFSPLICNLFYLRDFLTTKTDSLNDSVQDQDGESVKMTKDNFTPNLENIYMNMGIENAATDHQIGLEDLGLAGLKPDDEIENSFNDKNYGRETGENQIQMSEDERPSIAAHRHMDSGKHTSLNESEFSEGLKSKSNSQESPERAQSIANNNQ